MWQNWVSKLWVSKWSVDKLCVSNLCVDLLCVEKFCRSKLCVDKLCVDKLCGDKLSVSKLCVSTLCVDKLLVSKLCVDKLCVDKLCVDKLCLWVIVCVKKMRAKASPFQHGHHPHGAGDADRAAEAVSRSFFATASCSWRLGSYVFRAVPATSPTQAASLQPRLAKHAAAYSFSSKCRTWSYQARHTVP